jgi:hypothetical protein
MRQEARQTGESASKQDPVRRSIGNPSNNDSKNRSSNIRILGLSHGRLQAAKPHKTPRKTAKKTEI